MKGISHMMVAVMKPKRWYYDTLYKYLKFEKNMISGIGCMKVLVAKNNIVA